MLTVTVWVTDPWSSVRVTRTVAIPILATGSSSVDDIRPRYDTLQNHEDERGAIAVGTGVTALQVLDRSPP